MPNDSPSLDPWLAERFSAAARLGPHPSPEHIDASLRALFAGVDAEVAEARPGVPVRVPRIGRTSRSSAKGRPTTRLGLVPWLALGGGMFAALLLIFMMWRRDLPLLRGDHAHTYVTAIGQRATIRLRDGSRVVLAPNTTLSVDDAFGRASRTVTLVGEAYFDVAHASGAPFVVRTGNVTTQVLGTAFDIKRYSGDLETRVVVTQGKVRSVRSDRSGSPAVLTLTAGLVGRLTDSSARATSDDVAAYTAWAEGRLDFHQARVAEVLATMERWYGLRFKLTDTALYATRVSGSFDFPTTADALSVLKMLLDVGMTFDRLGDTTVVTLRPRNTRTSPATPERGRPHTLQPHSEVGR